MENKTQNAPKAIDIATVVNVIPTGTTQSVSVHSRGYGDYYTINGIPADVEIDKHTVIYPCPKTEKSRRDKPDTLRIVQLDENAQVVSERTFSRTEKGTYKEELSDTKHKDNAPVYSGNEPTYTM